MNGNVKDEWWGMQQFIEWKLSLIEQKKTRLRSKGGEVTMNY
jgi:hypothetical protein